MSENRELNLVRQVLMCLTSPRRLFKSILEEPNLFKAAMLIFLIAGTAAWATYNYTEKLPLTFIQRPERGPFPQRGGVVRPEQIRQALMIVNAVIKLIDVFGSWLIVSALIHGFSKVQGGKGGFRNMLMLAGYASTPLLIQHILRLIDSFVTTEQTLSQLMRTIHIVDQPFLNAIVNAAVDRFTIFQLWSVALLAIGIRENYKISTVRSAAAAAASFILMIPLSVFLPLS